MSSIVLNNERVANFTSSEIWKLTTVGKDRTSFGKPALTYIEEKILERRLCRSLSNDTEARATTWGTFMEQMISKLLGEYYSFTSSETLLHPTIPNWAGSPDGFKLDDTNTVVDFKAPYTLKSFCGLVDPIYKNLEDADAINWLRDNHDDGEKYYWQLISNACITGSEFGELIVYCPYESEIEAIQYAANQTTNPKYYFIATSPIEQLPYLKDGGYYSNLNIIRFPIPKEDKQKLEALVQRASELLIKI